MLYLDNKLIKDIIQWDVINWSQALYFWEKHLKKKKYNLKNKHVLEIGSRRGGLSLWAALNGGKVYCSDIMPPSAEAIKLHEKYKIKKNIKYVVVDLMNIPFKKNTFDVILFKSVLGALKIKENQYQAINEIYRVLKPDGLLLFAENLKASFIHMIMRKMFVNWSKYWRYIDIKEAKDFFSKFKYCEFSTYGFLSSFGRNEKQRILLSKIDKFFNKIIPEKFKYIIFGVVVK